jgi:hypothetical protein
MVRVPLGGQGVIHLENGHTFAGGSLRETLDVFTAITLNQGLKEIGMWDEVMKRKKTTIK